MNIVISGVFTGQKFNFSRLPFNIFPLLLSFLSCCRPVVKSKILNSSGQLHIMGFSFVITPVAIILELIVFIMGGYAGCVLKKRYGYLFGFTFFVFALFDFFGAQGISADVLSILNIVAIISALGGMYLIVKENAPRVKSSYL
jgi:hypothetical protein